MYQYQYRYWSVNATAAPSTSTLWMLTFDDKRAYVWSRRTALYEVWSVQTTLGGTPIDISPQRKLRTSMSSCWVNIILLVESACVKTQFKSPLWSSDRLCGLVVRVSGYRYRGLGFDSQRYQIFWVVLGLERGPLSLVRSIEELLE